jgi:hypothetical protein
MIVIRRTLLSALALVVAIGVTAGPGLAGGPSSEQLAAAGWTCFVPPFPGSGVVCFNPAQGRPPIPPLGADGRASYMVMRWTPAGEFDGHVHFIRADLYAGQPCPQAAGGEYLFFPGIGYYECIPI